MGFLDEARLWVSRSLEAYGQSGVSLSYTPSVKPVYGEADTRFLFAGVKDETLSMKVLNDTLNKPENRRRFWKRFYGVDVSVEAARQEMEVISSLAEKTAARLGEGMKYPEPPIGEGEIALFSPFREPANAAHRPHVMAHECWHLVEQEKIGDEMEGTGLIMEGTANHAANLLNNQRLRHIEPESREHLLYYSSALFVQSACEGRDNQLSAMLDPGFRREVQEEFARYITGLPESFFVREMRRPPYAKLMDGMKEDSPVDFPRKGATAEEVLRFYREMGIGRLADELEGQDLSSFMRLVDIAYNPGAAEKQRNAGRGI